MDKEKLDQALETLEKNKDRWANLPIRKKIDFLRRIQQGTLAVAERQVARAMEAKGIAKGSPQTGEEWLGGPLVTIRNIRLLLNTMEQIARDGAPSIPSKKIRTRPDGQVIVEVIPADTFDKLLYQDFVGEVWMQSEVQTSNLQENMGVFYQEAHPEGKVALVLGAGNVASIGPLDAIYKLFVEGQVCILKYNPVNEYLGPFIEEAFAPLYKEGFMRSAYGGADVGAYLCSHDLVEEIHITGSDKTHDAIVYGVGEEGAKRKQNNEPLLDKRITSELGNVSPVIVVPGQWSQKELAYQAQNVATQMTNNAGFNCNAAKLIITHKDWPQREAFFEKLKQTLKEVGPRKAYYPGAHDRQQSFVDAHDDVDLIGHKSEEVVPWTLVRNLDANNKDEMCFSTESFCGVTGETTLEARDAKDFLEKAVDFCNDTVWGTLNACIILHPKTQKEIGSTFEDSIAKLRYGSVVINHWPALCYGMGATTWGAYPGHTLDDIQSGIGVVHNAHMFEKPAKSVVYGPFFSFPRPPWFVPYKSTLHKMAPLLSKFEASPGWRKLPHIFLHALRK